MIKKAFIILCGFFLLSGCNLAISFLDASLSGETDPEPSSESTPETSPEPTPETTGEITPTVRNGDFETGDSTGWSGSCIVNAQSAYHGSYGAQISNLSSISQNITGLTPDTEYLISFYLKFDSIPSEALIKVEDCEDNIVEEPIINGITDWNFMSIPFTTCNESTEATFSIYCYTAHLNIDDIIVEVK